MQSLKDQTQCTQAQGKTLLSWKIRSLPRKCQGKESLFVFPFQAERRGSHLPPGAALLTLLQATAVAGCWQANQNGCARVGPGPAGRGAARPQVRSNGLAWPAVSPRGSVPLQPPSPSCREVGSCLVQQTGGKQGGRGAHRTPAAEPNTHLSVLSLSKKGIRCALEISIFWGLNHLAH